MQDISNILSLWQISWSLNSYHCIVLVFIIFVKMGKIFLKGYYKDDYNNLKLMSYIPISCLRIILNNILIATLMFQVKNLSLEYNRNTSFSFAG